MRKDRRETKNTIIVFLLIFLSGMFANLIRENKLFVKYHEIIIPSFIVFNFICGYLYWKHLKVSWLTILWVIIYGFSILVYLLCSIGYHYWGWIYTLRRQHIMLTLSPVTFVILYLLYRLARINPETKSINKF